MRKALFWFSQKYFDLPETKLQMGRFGRMGNLQLSLWQIPFERILNRPLKKLGLVFEKSDR
jgi:hypothetical protein